MQPASDDKLSQSKRLSQIITNYMAAFIFLSGLMLFLMVVSVSK
jgi:hypothetical protein